MPAWNRFPTRARLAARWAAPVWMDNRVNLSALGERRVNPLAAASRHTIYLGGGEAIGAAVVVDGRLYRGARGLAGEVGHVPVPEGADVLCRCGNTGCLDAVAGRAALVRDGRLLAETGQSPALAAVLAATGTIRPVDITMAADNDDAGCAGAAPAKRTPAREQPRHARQRLQSRPRHPGRRHGPGAGPPDRHHPRDDLPAGAPARRPGTSGSNRRRSTWRSPA